jgi:uncharacterized metal-binding protein
LLFACSGAANVAEVADKAARQLAAEGVGSMFCLAGLGAEIPGMVDTARHADLNVVIDGCPVDCAAKVFAKVGIANYTYVRVTDLGIEKSKGVRATGEQVSRVVAQVKGALGRAPGGQP